MLHVWYSYLQNWVLFVGQMLVNIPHMGHIGLQMDHKPMPQPYRSACASKNDQQEPNTTSQFHIGTPVAQFYRPRTPVAIPGMQLKVFHENSTILSKSSKQF